MFEGLFMFEGYLCYGFRTGNCWANALVIREITLFLSITIAVLVNFGHTHREKYLQLLVIVYYLAAETQTACRRHQDCPGCSDLTALHGINDGVNNSTYHEVSGCEARHVVKLCIQNFTCAKVRKMHWKMKCLYDDNYV